MDVGDYETNTVVVANIASISFRIYQLVSPASPSYLPSPATTGYPPLSDIERALRRDGHLVFTDTLRDAVWHFRFLRKDGSALGASTLPDLGAVFGVGPHTLAAVEEGTLDPASLHTEQSVLASRLGPNAQSTQNTQNTQTQNAPQSTASPTLALSFFDAAAPSPFALPSTSAGVSPSAGMDLDAYQPSPPSLQNQTRQGSPANSQGSHVSQGSSHSSQESQASPARQGRGGTPEASPEAGEPPVFAEVSGKVVYNFVVSAVLAGLAPAYCARSRAIALNARTFLLPPLDAPWDGRESSRTDSRALVATLRVTLTTAGALLMGVSHRVLRGLGCSAWACYAGLPPPGASVLTAPFGVFAIVRGVHPPSVPLDGEARDDSADEFGAEPHAARRKKKRRRQRKDKGKQKELTPKQRRQERQRRRKRQARRQQKLAVPPVPHEWKSFALDLLDLHGMSPAVLRNSAWLRLELPLDEEIPDGEPVEILWPSALCYWSLESPTVTAAPFERLNPLADIREAYLAQVQAEEAAKQQEAEEAAAEEAVMEEAAMGDVQIASDLGTDAPQLHDGPSSPNLRNPAWLAPGVSGSSAAAAAAGMVYPTPPDGVPNPVGATPTFDGSSLTASPGNTGGIAAPSDLDPSMAEATLGDDAFGDFWGSDEPKRDDTDPAFLGEPDNMFGNIGADMFAADDVTDADFSFFDEKPEGSQGPSTSEKMDVDEAVQGSEGELPVRSEADTPAATDAAGDATAESSLASPAPLSALASFPSFAPPPPPPAEDASAKPGPDDDGSSPKPSSLVFVKPELRHAPSRLAEDARGNATADGNSSSTKRPPSPFNALTVFKRVKAVAAANNGSNSQTPHHHSNQFEGLHLNEFMIQNTKKYEQTGKFGFRWVHPEADLQSDISSATSPTAFRRPVAGGKRPAPLSDASPAYAALVSSITRGLQSSSLQPRSRVREDNNSGEVSSDASGPYRSSDGSDGSDGSDEESYDESSSETDDDADYEEDVDCGSDGLGYWTDEDGFSNEGMFWKGEEEEPVDDVSTSEDDSDEDETSDDDNEEDDEQLAGHTDRRRKSRAMDGAVPLHEAAAELARACSEGVWDFPIARFFVDPMPPAAELAYADDDVVDVAQILTQQVTRATIRCGSGCGGGGDTDPGGFPWNDEDGPGPGPARLRQVLQQHVRHSVATLEAALPASLAGDAVRCGLKPYLEVVADTGVLQQQQMRQLPMAATVPPGGASLFPVPTPHVELRRNEATLSLMPTAVEFWEVLGLEPLHGPKDVRAVCLHPQYDGLADAMRGFLGRMRIAYESLRLGAHEPLAAQAPPVVTDGLVAFAPEAGPGAFPGEYEVHKLAQVLAAEDTPGASLVVYVVYCAGVGTAVVEACLAFQRLARLYAAAVMSRSTEPNDLVLQLVPAAFVASPTSLVREPSTADLLRLSLEVYDRCAAACGPRPAPSFLLEQPPPRMLDLRLSPTPSVDVQRENSCIHVAYAASADGRWVTAAWSDASGWRQFSAAYWVARKGEPAVNGFAAVAQEIWDNTCALVANLRVHWRAIVAKCGSGGGDTVGGGGGAFDDDEIAVWTELARGETRVSISLTLVRVDAQPSLELLPPLATDLTPPLPTILPLLSAATPAPTPQPTSSVFSPDQGGGGGGGNPTPPTGSSFGAYPTTPATPATPGGGGGGGPSQSPAVPGTTTPGQGGAGPSNPAANASASADAAAAAKLAAAGADPSAVADVDGNVVLVDIADSTWGAVAAHRLNTAATWVDRRPALVSGYLVKRGGTDPDDAPVVLEVDLVRVGYTPAAAAGMTPTGTTPTTPPTPTTPTTPTGTATTAAAAAAARGHDALLREILLAYRALGTLARARGILDSERDVRPWHVAAAERAARVLCQRM